MNEDFYKKKAEKVLKSFLKEIEKNGFGLTTKKFMSLNVLSVKDYFQNFVKLFKEYKFEVGKIKFLKLYEKEAKISYRVFINNVEVTIFVEFIHEVGQPAFIGKPGVIPAKLEYLLTQKTKKHEPKII